MIDFENGAGFDFEPSPDAKIVDAECFNLTDKEGNVRGRFGLMNNDRPSLAIFSKDRKSIAAMSIEAEGPTFILRDVSGAQVGIVVKPDNTAIIVHCGDTATKILIGASGDRAMIVVETNGERKIIAAGLETP